MIKCPNCGGEITRDTELYIIDGEVMGCGECVEVVYADERYYLEAIAQAQQDYMDTALWDRRMNEID